MLEKLQLIHLLSFIWYFILFAVLEYIFPLRKKIWDTKKRWFSNFGLSFINTIVWRLLLIITPASVAFYIQESWIWFFNFLNIPFVLELVISIILLDCLIYFQHVLSHKWKWFWKLHSIHHSDITLDVSTALRFHVLEIVLSLFIKIFFVILLWLNPISIVIFEIILVNSAIFSHSNLKLPESLDKILSCIIVTPSFHQVHHSVIHKQTDSNYWFFLSVWDKIFWTYTSHNFKVKKIWLKNNKNNLHFKDLILLDINKK